VESILGSRHSLSGPTRIEAPKFLIEAVEISIMIHDSSQTGRQNMGSRNDPGDLLRKEVPDILIEGHSGKKVKGQHNGVAQTP
jgi:hypothetical protein